MVTTFSFQSVHFLVDNISTFTDGARENVFVLHDRSVDRLISVINSYFLGFFKESLKIIILFTHYVAHSLRSCYFPCLCFLCGLFYFTHIILLLILLGRICLVIYQDTLVATVSHKLFRL